MYESKLPVQPKPDTTYESLNQSNSPREAVLTDEHLRLHDTNFGRNVDPYQFAALKRRPGCRARPCDERRRIWRFVPAKISMLSSARTDRCCMSRGQIFRGYDERSRIERLFVLRFRCDDGDSAAYRCDARLAPPQDAT